MPVPGGPQQLQKRTPGAMRNVRQTMDRMAGGPQYNNPQGTKYGGNLGSFMQQANAPKTNYTAESITQQKGGYGPNTVGPLDMATAAGQFASTDKMVDKWAGQGGKFQALKSDPSIVNTMNQAKANLANWNATTGQQLGYPLGMNTLGGVKPTTNLMLDRALNVGAGINPTTGMGLMDSLKSNAYVDRGQFSLQGLLAGIAGTTIGGPLSGILAGNILPKLLKKDEDSSFNPWGMPSKFDTDEGLHVAEYTPDPVAEVSPNIGSNLYDQTLTQMEKQTAGEDVSINPFFAGSPQTGWKNYDMNGDGIVDSSDLAISDDFLRRQTDESMFGKPPDPELMDTMGITEVGPSMNEGDPLFDIMTNPDTDLNGDGTISPTELQAAREAFEQSKIQSKIMQYGDMGLFSDRFPDTAEEKAAYAADPDALARKDAWIRKQMDMEAFNPGFKEWTTNIPMDKTVIQPEGFYDDTKRLEPGSNEWYDPLGWFTGNEVIQTGGYNPSTGLSMMTPGAPEDMASTFFHEGMHQGLDPISGIYPGEEAWIREMLGEPTTAGLGYSEFDKQFDQPGSQAFSNQLGWGNTLYGLNPELQSMTQAGLP